jgi:hypothetical protein
VSRRGRGWAYLGLVLGGAASIAGNVTHTVLTPATVPLERVLFTVIMPYVSLRDFALMIGESWFVATFWPVALSGFMVTCGVALTIEEETTS